MSGSSTTLGRTWHRLQPNLILKALPFQALLWIDETKIIAAGYDCVPMLVANQGAGWCGLYARRGHLRALP